MRSDWLTKWPEKLPALSETQSHQDRAQQQVQPVIKINDPADLMELEIYVLGKGTRGAWLVDQRIEGENPGISVLGRNIIPTSYLVGIWLYWTSSILKMAGIYFERNSLYNFFQEKFWVWVYFSRPQGLCQHHWGPNSLIQWHETYLTLYQSKGPVL